MMKKYIFTLLFTLAGLAGMAQTNEPLPSGAVQFSNQLWLNPADSTIWTGDVFDGKFVNLGSWHKVDSLASLRAAYVPDIATLEAYDGDEDVVVVTDTLRGGLFVYQSLGEDDGGTVFTATGRGSGYWHRQFNKGDGLNVLWYGADPTGSVDQSTLFADVLLIQSEKTGKVVIPTGVYRIDLMIGTIDMPGDIGVTWDLTIEGVGLPELRGGSDTTIQSLFGFTMRQGADLLITGIDFNADQNSARAVYLKAPTNTNGRSDITIRDNVIRNCYTEDPDLFSANGISFFGNARRLDITGNRIENILIGPDVLEIGTTGVNGIAVGNSFGFFPRYVTVEGNYINGVTAKDDTYVPDQVGVFISGGGTTDTLNSRVVITNNTIKNARSRFVKSQIRNTYVENNTCVIDSIVVPAATSFQAGIDVQYGDAYIVNNVIHYIRESHRRAIVVTERNDQPSNNIVRGNKIKTTETTLNSVILFDVAQGTNSLTGNSDFSDNMLVGSAAYFFECRIQGNGTANRVSVARNYADGLDNSFIYLWGTTGADLNILAYGNTKVGSAITGITLGNTINYTLDGSANENMTDINLINRPQLYVNGESSVEMNASGLTIGRKQAISEGYMILQKAGSGTPFRFVFQPIAGGNWTDFIGASSYRFDNYVQSTQYRLSALNTAPASATASGTTGEIRVTATHIYICTATNTWVRAALTTW